KDGYRKFLDGALAPSTAITPGDRVQITDSFPTRLKKRRALIAQYLGAEYIPQGIRFGAAGGSCKLPQNTVTAPRIDDWEYYFDSSSVLDSFVWDPPSDKALLLELIRPNAINSVVGPVDERVQHSLWHFEGENFV